MKNRPLVFIILASLHIIEPLLRVLYLKYQTGFEMMLIIDNVTSPETFKAVFEFWFLFPLAGIALLGVKKWSYPLFVATQAYSVYTQLTYQKFTWPYVSETPFIPSVALLIFNILIIAYFLLPEVRKPFFDQTVRWWETDTRYNQTLPCSLTFGDPNNLVDIEVLNISQTGAFLRYDKPCMSGQPLQLHMSYKDVDLTISATVIRVDHFQDQQGIGVSFNFNNVWEKWAMRKIIKALDKENEISIKKPQTDIAA